jgi:succinate dehydrogenase / fumarate reductase flavoprotein subunit
MGGLWVDYNLMSNLPGLHVLGEANFSDHGANRLGASALMQGLADGYFVIPTTIANYLVHQKPGSVTAEHPEFKKALEVCTAQTKGFLNSKGKRSVDSFHRELGLLVWDKCGMARDRAGLTEALKRIPELREEFKTNVVVPGSGDACNPELEKAGRVAAKKAAAVISAPSTNTPMARQNATTKTSATPPLGAIPATSPSPRSTKSR